MVFKKILLIISLYSIISCGYIRITKNEYGEPILNKKTQYTFVDIPTEISLKKIDTSAYYVQIFEGRFYNEREKENPQVLIFHNDGFFKQESLLTFGKNDNHRNKNSVYYGGKYKIIENDIELEQFFPSTAGKTNYYVRNISRGRINGNKIIFEDKNSLIKVFEKKQKLN